jgi:arylsulfatase A-like enzyme
VDRPVENADLFPTLLELCDLPVPPGGTGTSLLGLLTDPGEDTRPPFAVSSTRWVHALVTEDGWKLIVPTAAGREAGLRPELYRLDTDPHERENLAADRPELVRELGELLETRLEKGLRADGDAALSEANRAAMRELGYVE